MVDRYLQDARRGPFGDERPRWWKLAEDGKTPVPCANALEFGQWFETADRVVAQTDVAGFFVSTVFLGLDHSHGIGDRPVLFETMVWHDGEVMDEYSERYHTWDEANTSHTRVINTIAEKYGLKPE